MIKDFVRSAVAVILVVLLAGNGSFVLVASTPGPAHSSRAPRVQQTADLFDRSGKVVLHVEGENLTDRTVSFMRALRSDAETRARLRAAVLAFGKLSKTAPQPSPTLQILDALAAPTTSQFHDTVRRLPVSVSRTTPGDGLSGRETRFFVRGTERLRLKTLESTAAAAAPVTPPSLPLESSEADAEPDAAAPDPAVTADDECYVDNEPVACATEQEREDAMVAALAMDDEATTLEVQVDSEMNEYYEYCSQNPWDCEDLAPGAEAVTGGPSMFAPMDNCNSKMWNFVGAAASTHGAAIGLVGLLLSPVAVPALVVVGGVLVIGGGLAWMYSAGTDVIDCKRAKVR